MKDINSMADMVGNTLIYAKECGLEVEVMTWALMLLKDNINLSVQDALTMAIDEWLK